MGFIRENILKIVVFVVALVVAILIISFALKGTGLNNVSTYDGMEESLKTSAQKYVSKNQKLLPKSEEEQSKINLDTLVNEEYIDELYSLEDENIKCSGYVMIILKNDNYKYTPYIKCGKYYETKTIADYIKSNSEIVTSDSGLYQDGDKYIYKGENPDNYLMIGERTYRIIEITKDNELRLISADSYDDNAPWDDRYNIETDEYYGINDFSKSRIKDTLDDAYDSEYFTDEERNFIIEHNVCVGKRALSDESIDGVSDCSVEYANQKVGLINVSDYMRASSDSNCTNTASVSCTNYNYLEYITSSYTTLNAVSDNSYEVYRIYYGISSEIYANSQFSVYPVVYIDPLALYSSGDGTQTNPYIMK